MSLQRGHWIALGVGVWILLGVLVTTFKSCLGSSILGAPVMVDNSTSAEVQVALDDQSPWPIGPYELAMLHASKGRHTLVVRDAKGAVIQATPFTIDHNGEHVLQIGTSNHYAIYSVEYVSQSSGGYGAKEPVPIGEGASFFALPPEVEGSLNDAPPEKIKNEDAKRSIVQPRVFHTPIHRDRPCCKYLVRMGLAGN